ncbi:MAG: hypothetical protein LC687_00125 [Actinobacteria bacterium]|nr:hypothetical protein [Actinomycetota bacterium]MCA1806276.1 hypothetical protein [Actinomycetota bacterium]
MADLDVKGNSPAEISDDEFDAFVNENQQEANREQSNQGRTFSDILYTHIPPAGRNNDVMKIVRFRGGPPDSDRTPYTARRAISSLVRDDNDKLTKLRLPVGDYHHLYWRIINSVLEQEGKGQAKTYVNKDRMPDVFNRVRYGSVKPTANQFKYDKGWKGREWLVANVIDREQMDVHREEKHTMILCKDARSSKNNPDVVFYDEGVPAYGFVQPLVQSLFKPYKNWENYDVGIFRLGQKEMPYRLINASRYLPEVPEHMQSVVVPEGPLTEEELSWDLYDLRRLTRVTPYSRFFERFGQLVMEVDNHLGTTFFEELQDKVAQEELENPTQEASTPSVSTESESIETEAAETTEPEVKEEPVPEVRSRPARQPVEEPKKAEEADPVLAAKKQELREAGFTEEELALITGYDPSNKAAPFTYSVPTGQLLRCSECGVPSPGSFRMCPACLTTF